MKCIKIVSLLFLSLLFFTSCNVNEDKTTINTADEIYKITSIEDMPSREDISKLSTSDLITLKRAIEYIPFNDCEKYYIEKIDSFLEEYDETSLLKLTISHDDLSLVYEKNNKSLLNLIFTIGLQMDTSKMVGSADIAQDISKALMDYLMMDSYFKFKVKDITISIYSLNGSKINTAQGSMSIIDELIFKEQPQLEYDAQSVAYNFSLKNKSFVLQRFGSIKQTNELYVEYYVKDDYFGTGDKVNKNIANLENIKKEITDILLSNGKVKEYIKESSINSLTISFNSGIFETSYLKFNSKL